MLVSGSMYHSTRRHEPQVRDRWIIGVPSCPGVLRVLLHWGPTLLVSNRSVETVTGDACTRGTGVSVDPETGLVGVKTNLLAPVGLQPPATPTALPRRPTMVSLSRERSARTTLW
jgi:hypothetical protein